jgi:HPt (histidine-containing phosphotransfer) domain-containing protein
MIGDARGTPRATCGPGDEKVATMVDYELNELRREFLDEAREKVSEMESALDGGRNPQSLDRLAYLAHQLKGSGGSYGYQRISDDAAELEKAVESLTGAEKSPTDSAQDPHLAKFVGSLREEIDRAAKELA